MLSHIDSVRSSYRREEVAEIVENSTTLTHPGEGLKTDRMPGHWVLARLGKRVLRPGGMELTRRMLTILTIKPSDRVIEFAPGMGRTAHLTLALDPSSYTAVERDGAAAKIVGNYLSGPRQTCVVGDASDTGLPAESATVVYGEAMLTMQTDEVKRTIVREAYRLLEHGGRYGIHEMCLMHEDLTVEAKQAVERSLTGVVHHGVRPLTIAEWRQLLESEGFEVKAVEKASMSLLEPGRLLKDEGVAGALRFVFNVLRDGEARRRVLEMRRTFRRNRKLIGAVAFLAVKA
jgi:ubiquinone/menaquinone biosynthesis C-methylase UbiE